ncbi:MAG: chaperone required for assembly of F1-ATPase [Halocynthiibacter sp.]|jgi:chaperone required for assembly of F1-ATPase
MSDWAAKRFWKETAVQPAEDGAGFEVRLDGRMVRTPAKTPLVLPTRAMAEAIAAEWDAQEGKIKPLSMPVTRGANAALDKVAEQHSEVADMIADYGDSDLLCYRAASPVELIERQTQAWDPLLEWAETALNARLLPRTGVIHQPQDDSAIAALRGQVHALDPFELAAFHDLVAMSGSLIIGFAALHEYAPISQLWDLSRVDEDWQIEQWGKDDEAAELSETKRAAFTAAQTFYQLVHTKS